jgi:hypothetical protein
MLPRAKYEENWILKKSDFILFFFRCFGFVSKKINGAKSSQPENECHVFAEVEPSQSSAAIVNFVSKILIGSVPV